MEWFEGNEERDEGEILQEKEVVLQRGERQWCGTCEQRVRMFVVKFFRQPTEETLDGKKPGRNPRQPAKRRRKEMLKNLMAKLQNEEGQGLVEYALIIVLVAVVCIAGLQLLAPAINGVFSDIAGSL